MMSEKDLRWNKFIEEVCEKDITKPELFMLIQV